MKVPVDLIDQATTEFDADTAAVREIRERIRKESNVELDGAEHVERRRRMIASVTVENVDDAFERYIGDNDLLPINYLLLGYLQSRSVGRIRYYDRREGKGSFATGFLVSDGLVVTNHHVFPADDHAELDGIVKDPSIEFNYEFDVNGDHPAPVVFALDPARFFHTSKELDLAIVAVSPMDATGVHAIRDQGYLVLNGALGKAGVGDSATIIQHPDGNEKQIAVRENQIIDTSHPTSIIYVCDTAPGSSGAPVFNDQWQVIALHSAGVPKKNADGDYVDEHDEVIPVVNRRIDESRVVWMSNRGTRVSAIMAHLQSSAEASHPLVQALLAPGYTDARPYAFLSRPTIGVERAPAGASERTTGLRAPAAPAPVAPAPPLAPIQITINVSPHGATVVTGQGIAAPGAPGLLVDAFEKKSEDIMDFSDCTGFDATFLGVQIPMPTPSAKLRKKLATLEGSASSYLLKYHHVSTIHHALRRVPVVSGVNVQSGGRFALGRTSDTWFRDNRIDYDVQLNDAFYAYSNFDKGHLARREDAEWGTSAERALRAAVLTNSYANAVPQVPALNRISGGGPGRWYRLENELLEKGVARERGKPGKICVFSGPIFHEDDPVFKGVQVALDFFKIVVWFDEDGKRRTTCYRLSQTELVGEIEFEVLRFDDVFKAEQVAIGTIEKATQLKFHENITRVDTFAG